jgi:hypothetical protein
VTEEKVFLPGAEELKVESGTSGGAKGLKTLLLEKDVEEKEVIFKSVFFESGSALNQTCHSLQKSDRTHFKVVGGH